MPAPNVAKPAPAATGHRLLGERLDRRLEDHLPIAEKSQGQAWVIHAEIAGDDFAAAEGVSARGHAPVLRLCRALIEAGVDPRRPLHAYRGNTLCLIVRSIGAGAGLRIASHGVGFERLPECTAGPCMRETGEACI